MLNPDAGLFIDLEAFRKWSELQGASARLPSFQTIVRSYPELIAAKPLRRTPMFVTHRWDGPDHPDPSGWQLRALRNLAEDYHYHEAGTCFWYDYMSLPQRPRNADENRLFTAGLNSIRQTVAQCDNICLVSRTGQDHADDREAMRRRGWILFELFIARSNMTRPVPLYERENASVQFGRGEQYEDTFPDMMPHAPLDTPQHLHDWLVRREIRCTNGSDLLLLSRLLHDELTRPQSTEPLPEFEYGAPVRLSARQLISMEFWNATSLSSRLPEAFLLSRELVSYRTDEEQLWDVVIVWRPPLPTLGQWHAIAGSDVKHMNINWEEQASPRYPGIRFEMSRDGLRFMAALL
ncbi:MULTISPECIES: hypothetical protein [unclassified Mesorhizobium]|uniref:hypothetical protein n=1 Tax=unclassified Mesorhizobium TaxID=325217 RepID=UPI0011283994|nr:MULTISPECIES: hypothetical protein [unclassified Mesorhizobium]MBZ9703251.1 hypothetical protein [Mesorhizobium sp. CO1-1-3]MBZ9947102.1 hypothetical protein [Mesorhizobium sp. BR1-1-11]TPJ06674.1 hypothetical protein FJ428_10695 [Mesorhizobium sp. B2-8-1]